ncbi:MAG: hypothetical protein JW863_11500 [Chitinispirillaceae bacterium]|nr:hypothetical protein [Chitinispirillaceae bacterium]
MKFRSPVSFGNPLAATLLFCVTGTVLGIPASVHTEKNYVELSPPADTGMPYITELRPSNTPAPPSSPLPGACSDCDKSHGRWFTNVKELRETAYYCGFDYLDLRFTQHFTSDTLAGRLTVFARSLLNDSLVVDSAITVFRTPTSADQTVTVYSHQPRHPCYLPLPSPAAEAPDPDEKINAVIRRANTFTSRCRFLKRDFRDSWVFSVDGNSWLLEKGRLVHKDTALPDDRSSFSIIEYRLASWGATPRYPSSFTAGHSIPPEFVKVAIHDSVTICRIQLECASRYGLKNCRIICGSRMDTVRFSGEQHRSADIILNARPDDSLLTFLLSDIHGNSTLCHAPLFAERREREEQWARNRTIDLLSRERAAQNPITYAAYVLSKFSGDPSIGASQLRDGRLLPGLKVNPVSTLFKTIFKRKSERYLAGIGDTTPAGQPVTFITFPLQGTVSNQLFAAGTGMYSPEFYTEKCTFNGTRAAILVNPTLRQRSPEQQHYHGTVIAPLYEGRFPQVWSLDTVVSPDSPAPRELVLVASSADISSNGIALHDLPCLFRRPSSSAEFSVLHVSEKECTRDTLTVTYRVCYTDRTSDLIWHRFGISSAGVKVSGTNGKNMKNIVSTLPRFSINSSGEKYVLLDVQVNGEKMIFRVDTFVHSMRKNQVVGWGVASLPG